MPAGNADLGNRAGPHEVRAILAEEPHDLTAVVEPEGDAVTVGLGRRDGVIAQAEIARVNLPVAVLVWLMIIPQRRQMKEQRQLLAELAEGDAVVTASGIYGIVTELDGDVMFVEVCDGIELKMARSAVTKRIVEPTEAPAEDPK